MLAVACSGGADDGESAGPLGTLAVGSTPPDVDVSVHDVPLDEIYFDTFDGGSVRLSESTPQLRTRLLDAIPPIDTPVYGDVSSGDWLAPEDLVVGYVAGDVPHAYPFKILNFHEIVNDDLAGLPVLVSYCPLCRSAVVYDRRVDDRVLSFGNTSALYESDLVMVDRNTGSYWWQVAGRAIVGPLTGTSLTPLPSVVSTWSDWVMLHPETLVLTRETGFSRPYERDSFASYEDFLDSGEFIFPVTEAARDPRLRAADVVVGIQVGEEIVAYPVATLKAPVNDRVAGTAVVVIPGDGGAAVFERTIDGDVLEFEADAGRVLDTNTGSEWRADGLAVSGPLKGRRLDSVPTRTTFWFAFVGAFPGVEIRTR